MERASVTATRERLYQAAAALFAERGYENTTMADIAERAGTSRRTAFNYFPNKSDIPMFWTRRLADRSLIDAGDAQSLPTEQRVRDYLRGITRVVEAEPEISRQMMSGWAAAKGPIIYESTLLPDLELILQAGVDAGSIDSDTDIVLAARTISDALMGATFRWVREARTSYVDAVDAAADLILRALRPAQ
ncbi:TetR/AcrR family transcriptional regulator [Microbacterium sp. No. 7]|uniref:TetR/AcrR family transcriptional regulator n=1 Tax=Microbacterium sp. No. 7 TaxID=1714373 RepID=UPI0006D0B041|nr:TetR family transcriptional regulator [Microbacterium sp. No. 7]ALJ18613.1 TetR family transcriptional regulator [Microbacterium sp. No. 7]